MKSHTVVSNCQTLCVLCANLPLPTPQSIKLQQTNVQQTICRVDELDTSTFVT